MADPLKARISLIVSVAGDNPFTYRVDVLALTRDPQWAFGQATYHLHIALRPLGASPRDIKILSHTIDWISLRRPRTEDRRV